MIGDKHLLPIKPEFYNSFNCPSCGEDRPDVIGQLYPGIHVLGHYKCASCSTEFFRDLPIGFANDHALSVTPRGKLLGDQDPPGWLTTPFLKGFKKRNDAPVTIERTVHKECKRVIILNTLDFLYGHVLLKLFNAQHYLDKYPDQGLVLLLPRMYSWLIPEGVAETWIVDLKLGQMQDWYPAVDGFVKEQMPRFDEVMLGRGYSHPDQSKIDLERYTGIPTFKLEQFTERPAHFTFVARTDRLWFKSTFGKFMYRVYNKLGLKKSLGQYYVKAQNKLMQRTIHRIRKELPQASFSIVGLGERSSWVNGVKDLRSTNMNEELERTWCRAYAQSQVVIGVHGSNMLLPTAFAAGCIEILPYDRYGNIVQDVSVRHADRMQLFLYRFVDEFASPQRIARHAISMHTDYPVYNNNNRVNVF